MCCCSLAARVLQANGRAPATSTSTQSCWCSRSSCTHERRRGEEGRRRTAPFVSSFEPPFDEAIATPPCGQSPLSSVPYLHNDFPPSPCNPHCVRPISAMNEDAAGIRGLTQSRRRRRRRQAGPLDAHCRTSVAVPHSLPLPASPPLFPWPVQFC
ncbi:hypothetical protein GALMADRAFT_808916 [Galerina marginata CBS 339.88]|uniref:Uncharacterized protein n=1 Tax=Galerina marginata (strain CBS 339.88) TaxID=685588 RepID=A0A067STY7_GALM3|nr:hypothetical protein GALMADRAFT_808916 [Galerina marginata CBS 339.88]